MKDGTNNQMSKTRKGDREIISVSLPLSLYDAMEQVCDHYNMNRSAMVASAVSDYLKTLGVRVGEQ
jgi:metal-responsive CopG/Arc/MetJ family transcriptional regulator